MVWGRGGLEDLGLGFVDPLDQVEDVAAPPGLGTGPRVQAGRLPGVGVADDVAVEPVHGLTLVLGGPELGRVQAEGVVWAAGVSLIRPVQERAGAPPAPVDQLLVEGRRQGGCDGIIGITCRGQLLAMTMGHGADPSQRSVGDKLGKIGGLLGSSRRIYSRRGDGHGDVTGRRRKIHVLWTDHCESRDSIRTRTSCYILNVLEAIVSTVLHQPELKT